MQLLFSNDLEGLMQVTCPFLQISAGNLRAGQHPALSSRQDPALRGAGRPLAAASGTGSLQNRFQGSD